MIDNTYPEDEFERSAFVHNLEEALASGMPYSSVTKRNEKRADDWRAREAQAQKMSFNKDMKRIHGDKWTSSDDMPSNNSPFNVVGKIQLSDKDLNKKRW